MIQFVLMIFGAIYLFKLLMLRRTGAKLGFQPDALDSWKAERRKQFLWMIAAGWGSFALMLVLFLILSTFGVDWDLDDIRLQAIFLVFVVVVMVTFYSLSDGARKRADALEKNRAQ